ncbi:MAG: hypothetical protein GX359_08765 [Clostridiales bacterium]|nr:hypothetical protein [Clostridiales bacterium]
MKLKYKKIIMLTTMSTMGIGLLTLSISKDSSKAEERSNDAMVQEANLLLSAEGDHETLALADDALAMENSETASPTATPSPTPTPIPVYELEKTTNQEIQTLFEEYYTAKNSSDVEKIKSLLTDPSKAPTVEQLQRKTEYIDDYRNIETYLKKSLDNDAYIAYVYQEIKFNGVNTMAPGVSKFYLVQDDNGKYKIYSDEMDEELKEYYDARNNDSDVQELLNMTNEKGEEAKSQDEDLKTFWDSIDKLASERQENSEE